MEIIFLFGGLTFMTLGGLIIFSEVKARSGMQPVNGRVIGFSTGTSKNTSGVSFHSVAEYAGFDGHKYYIEGSVGSSAPLHAVGDPIKVFVSPMQPENAVLEYGLSLLIGAIVAGMGLIAAIVFWFTFHANLYSVAMAVFVAGGLALNVRKGFRKHPMSMEEWQQYKKQIFAPRVFS